MADLPHPPGPAGRIPLPLPPQKRARRDFPLLASVAPVVGSLVIWAVTQSPFALVFAFLGPVIAVAGVIDDLRLARRHAAQEKVRFRRGVDAVLAEIEAGHERERESLARQATRPDALLHSAGRDPEWWRDTWDNPIPVCLGIGTTASALELEPAPGQTAADRSVGFGRAGADETEIDDAYGRLRAAAATVTDAAVLVDARQGIGIIGEPVPAGALARSVVAQLAFRLSPADVSVSLDDSGSFAWAGRLPHPRTAGGHPDRIEFQAAGADSGRGVLCATARHSTGLPRDCRIVIRLDRAGAAVLERNPTGRVIEQLRPWFVSESQGRALLAMASDCAVADGLVRGTAALPGRVAFADLQPAAPVSGRLPASFASCGDEVLTLDLVVDGPHAVIGGTTGSGKSELLISWVLALATACSPAEVNFLLVDFKGGSSFAAVSRLPHTVGLITDLDQAAASRALASLRAELRHRERVIAGAGARSIDDLDGEDRMPRLVIVVDEFAVVASEFPDLQALFADLASRGRSLGIHLILCTQRPAGVIRDSVLANCSIRLSLRVNNGADSTAVIGTAAAAELPLTPHGRCCFSVGGAIPRVAQIALATAGDASRVLARWADADYRVRLPWCEPLGDVVLPHQVDVSSDGGLAFGLSDVPEEQRQPAAVYDPNRDGNLVVLGGHNSGKSGVLAALQAAIASTSAESGSVRIPPDVEGAWDTVTTAVRRLTDPGAAPGAGPALYLLDDVDALLGRFPDDYRLAFADQLARLLREGPNRGSRVVLTAARLSSGIQSLVALCDSRLLLRMPSRQEHLLAGGDGQQYAAELPPGGGIWRGHRVQVMFCPAGGAETARQAEWTMPPTGFALVAADAHEAAERLRAYRPPEGAVAPEVVEVANQSAGEVTISTGHRAGILVGSPAHWQSQWALFAAARASGPVVFTGGSVAEFRMLTGSRALPPPIGPDRDRAWVLAPDGSISRVRLPKQLTS